MEKIYDVTALGELLIDFLKMEQVHRAIRFWKPIREAHHATYSPCLKSLGKRPHLSEKSEKICSENS